MQSADTSTSVSRHGAYYIDEGDLVVRVSSSPSEERGAPAHRLLWLLQAEDTLYRFHSFHIERATSYLDAKIQALSDVPANEGGSDDNPLVLDEVKSQDFEHLMWFFYESAYKWCVVLS